MGLETHLQQQLQQIQDANLYRTRRVIEGGHGVDLRVNGKACTNFCSNDYLGLAADPRLAAAAKRTLDESGTGSGASALVSGYNRHHAALEQALAAYTGCERALLFTSGWAANLGVLRALLNRESSLIADELNHASLIDGGRLSGAQYLRVAHADSAAFGQALQALPGSRVSGALPALLATDSVFSMDGDLAPLLDLSAMCRRHDVPLMIDDAHGFGVLGATGRGACEAVAEFGELGPRPDIYVATLGKAAGCAGAFVAGSEALIEFLIQRARSWVFSTAPPPALAAAALAAVQIMDKESEHRLKLRANIEQFVNGASERGLDLGSAGSAANATVLTPIQPLIVGDERRALAISQSLQADGFWVAAIRPPTVAPGTSRLRITLSAAHGSEQIDSLLDSLLRALARHPAPQPC